MIIPTEASFQLYGEKYNTIPLQLEISGDLETPITLFLKLQKFNPVYLLESSDDFKGAGRYSFIGVDTLLSLKESQDKPCLTIQGKNITLGSEGGFDALKETIDRFQSPSLDHLPKFYGGLVGFLGYDMVAELEKIPVKEKSLAIPDYHFLMTQVTIAYDHLNHKIKLIYLAENTITAYQKGKQKLLALKEAIISAPALADEIETIDSAATSNLTQPEFETMVKDAKKHIQAGDIFQVVLSQRFHLKTKKDALNIYRKLREINPSPYMFFLDFDDYQIIGTSPEMLVRVENQTVETHPIAGTRKRGETEAEDQKMIQELLNDPKELSEHLMLVDLGRNDIGRISEPGSVQVVDYAQIDKFSHVMHLTSKVTGKLQQQLSPVDALKACFPAGTVSGAPKVRAMEIIHDLEKERRHFYAGSVAYLGLNQTLDSCITIRTLLKQGENVYLQAGAGIVADSEPAKEYQETINKSAALLKAFQGGDSK